MRMIDADKLMMEMKEMLCEEHLGNLETKILNKITEAPTLATSLENGEYVKAMTNKGEVQMSVKSVYHNLKNYGCWSFKDYALPKREAVVLLALLSEKLGETLEIDKSLCE